MFQAIQELTGQGEIIASSPTAQQIEQEQAGFELEVCFIGTAAEQVEAAVRAVDDVAGVEVTPFGDCHG
jgi:hypothetical protein